MSFNQHFGNPIGWDSSQFDLRRVVVGAGWKFEAPAPKNILEKILSGGVPSAFDLDIIAFLLDEEGKVRNLGRSRTTEEKTLHLVDSDVIYYDNLRHPDGHIWHTGDDSVGGSGGDDEQIIVDLDNLGEDYHHILFMAFIHKGAAQNQHFGMMEAAYIRALDAHGQEIMRYNLAESSDYNGKYAIRFGSFSRTADGWEFYRSGMGLPTDNFMDELKKYVYD